MVHISSPMTHGLSFIVFQVFINQSIKTRNAQASWSNATDASAGMATHRRLERAVFRQNAKRRFALLPKGPSAYVVVVIVVRTK